jgi:hypothetical protein
MLTPGKEFWVAWCFILAILVVCLWLFPQPEHFVMSADGFARNPEAVAAGVGAIATIFIAIFTFTLKRSTDKLWVAGKDQLKLARAEFISSHRPRIILRDVHLEGRQVFYMLINTGDTDATIVESWILGEFVPDGVPIRPLRSFGHDDLGRLVLAAGETRDLTYDLPGDIGFAIMFPDSRRIGIEGPPVFGQRYFAGTIVYADDLGVRRRSVFRRIWVDDRHAFVRLTAELERDHEYAD